MKKKVFTYAAFKRAHAQLKKMDSKAKFLYLGRGVIGRRVAIKPGTERTAVVIDVRIFPDGSRRYRVDDKTWVYHSYEPMLLRGLPSHVLDKLPQKTREEYIERLINPPVVISKSPWFPKSTLRFVRGDYEAK